VNAPQPDRSGEGRSPTALDQAKRRLRDWWRRRAGILDQSNARRSISISPVDVDALRIPDLFRVLPRGWLRESTRRKGPLLAAERGDFWRDACYGRAHRFLFFAGLPQAAQAVGAPRSSVPFADQSINIMTAEDLIVLKVLFWAERKNFADLERLLGG